MADTSTFAEDKRMMVGKNYHFFNRANHIGLTMDYPDYYGHLLSQATESIKVWDPYFIDGDEDLFTNVQVGVDVTILYMIEATRGRKTTSLPLADVKSRVGNKLPTGHGNLKVVCLPNTDSKYDARKWHDRFLIIDDTFVYLIGASLRYQHFSAKCFGIYEVWEDEDAALIKERFERTLFEVSRNSSNVL